ncbi:MAG: hypothetical protein V3T08_03990 [Gemmatimonadota bacterium]
MAEDAPPPPKEVRDQDLLDEIVSRLQGGEFARWIDLVLPEHGFIHRS